MPRQATGTTLWDGDRNRAVARELWRAVADGDVDGIRRLLAPDVVLHTHGSGHLDGTRHGPDAFVDFLARNGEVVDSLTSHLIDIFSGDTGAVLYYGLRARRGARALDTEGLLVLRIERGVVVEAFTTTADPSDAAGFWRSH